MITRSKKGLTQYQLTSKQKLVNLNYLSLKIGFFHGINQVQGQFRLDLKIMKELDSSCCTKATIKLNYSTCSQERDDNQGPCYTPSSLSTDFPRRVTGQEATAVLSTTSTFVPQFKLINHEKIFEKTRNRNQQNKKYTLQCTFYKKIGFGKYFNFHTIVFSIFAFQIRQPLNA